MSLHDVVSLRVTACHCMTLCHCVSLRTGSDTEEKAEEDMEEDMDEDDEATDTSSKSLKHAWCVCKPLYSYVSNAYRL